MSQTMAFHQSYKLKNRSSMKKGSGCLKCGKTGHWARDCTAPREERIDLHNSGNSSQRSDVPQSKNTQPAETDSNDNNNPDIGFWDFGEHAAPAEGKLAELAARGAKRKQPKLESRHFVQEDGIPLVYTSFPGLFRKRLKGPGHEVGDLRRFFELYERWHHKMFPSKPFNVFVERMEALSSRAEIQSCLATLRNREVHGIDPFGGMFGDEDAVGEEREPASAEGQHTPATGAAGARIDTHYGSAMEEEEEEDYMVHLQQQAEQEAEPGLCQTSTPAQMTEDVRKRIQENKRLAMEKLAARKQSTVDAAATSDTTTHKQDGHEHVQSQGKSLEAADSDKDEDEVYLRNLEEEFESFENIAAALPHLQESVAEVVAAGTIVQENTRVLEVSNAHLQDAQHCDNGDAAADYGFEFDDGTGDVEVHELEEEATALGEDSSGPTEVVLETEAPFCMDDTGPIQEIAVTSSICCSKNVEHLQPPGSTSPVFSRQRRCKDLTDSESEED